MAACLNNLAGLLYSLGNYEAARPFYDRALAIYEKRFGPEHPATATSLNHMGRLLATQGDYDGA